MRYKRACKYCDKVFQPTGRFHVICEECRLETYPYKRPNKSNQMKENKKFPYKKVRK